MFGDLFDDTKTPSLTAHCPQRSTTEENNADFFDHAFDDGDTSAATGNNSPPLSPPRATPRPGQKRSIRAQK